MGICFSKHTSNSRGTLCKNNRVHNQSTSRHDQLTSSTESKDQVFQYAKEDAERMLQDAERGAYLLSRDITSELFISVSNGKYVSHHSISKSTDGAVTIGCEQFKSTYEMLNFYKSHSIGETTLSFELTTLDNSMKKDPNKSLSRKSELSWHLNPTSSFEQTSEHVSELKSSGYHQNSFDHYQKREIKTVKEEKITGSNSVASHSDQTVSSAGEMDLPIDEPLPILPEPLGRRPPPLASFSQMNFGSIFNSSEVNQIIKFSLPKDCTWTTYVSTKMIKVLILGTHDTLKERKHFMNEFVPNLINLSYNYGFHCDVSNVDLSSCKTWNDEWDMESETSVISSMESSYLKQFGIPIVAVIFTSTASVGSKLGPPKIPRKLTKEEFNKANEVLGNERIDPLADFYLADPNDLNLSYNLDHRVIGDEEKMQRLHDICFKLLAKCFEGEDDLWECFSPEIERQLELIYKKFENFEAILIENGSSVEREDQNSLRALNGLGNENNHDGNLVYRLKQKEKKYLLELMNKVGIHKNDIISMNSSQDNRADIFKEIQASLERKLFKIMKKFPFEMKYHHFLDSEVFSHLIDCNLNLKMNFQHFDVLGTIKAYIEGPFKKPLILYGGEDCVQSFLVAKTCHLALDWFGQNACIITRLVGSTEDSASLRLLLRSICLQISLAFNTDPASVPQDLSELIQFLPSLFRFATDSQPLVICIAQLTDVQVYNKEFECFNLIPNALCDNVKVILTIHKQHLAKAKEIYKDKNSFKQVNGDTPETALEMIDNFLIAESRTISNEQKKTVNDYVLNCHSPIYVKIFSEHITQLRSYDDVSMISSKQGNVVGNLGDFFLDGEKKFGKDFASIFFSLLTISKFGISKRCLFYVMSHETMMADEALVSKVDEIFRYFSSFIKFKWRNGLVVFLWFDSKINEVVHKMYFQDSKYYSRILQRIIEYFTREPNKYEIKDLKIDATNSSNHHFNISKSSSVAYNWEKLASFPHFLIISRNVDSLKAHALCNFEFLFDKLEAFSLTHLLNDFYMAMTSYPEDVDLKIVVELLELSTAALTFDTSQFPAQIMARMHPFENCFCDNMQLGAVERTRIGSKEVAGMRSEIALGGGDLVLGGNKNLGVSEAREKEIKPGKLGETGRSATGDSLISSQSRHLIKLKVAALEHGHDLMPTSACFVRPQSDCGVFAENQMTSFWLKTDTRIVFIAKQPDKFITWSCKGESIKLYDWKCRQIKCHRGVKLKRALFTQDTNLVVEMRDGTYRIYDVVNGEFIATMDSDLLYFAVCDLVHVAALNKEFTSLVVYNVRQCEVVWQFEAPKGRCFYNVFISRNGAIAACLLEASCNSNNNISDDVSHNHGDGDNCDEVEEHNKLMIVNLKSRQFLHRIELKRDQLLHELCAISEDGHCFAYLTETGSRILVWDLIKGNLIHEIETELHRVLKILISSQGNCILTVSADSILRLWNLSNGQLRFTLSEPISSIRGGYMDDTHCLNMSEDGSRAVHSLNSRFHFSYVVLWDLVEGRRLATLTTDFYGLSYEISPDGRYVTSCMPSGLVTLCSGDMEH